MKTFRCQDAGFDCNAVIKAESEDEILKQAAQHAATVHQVEVSPAMAAQIRSLIKDDNAMDPEKEAEKGHS